MTRELTDGMKAVLRKLAGKPDGVRLSDLDERTVNALVVRKLVRVVMVDVSRTPKGRVIPAHQRVYVDTYGKRITFRPGAWLRDDSGLVVNLGRVELVGEWFGDHSRAYWVPCGGRKLYALDRDVHDVDDLPKLKRVTFDAADEINTGRLTCRECGKWLDETADGYGTEHGWCGCEDSETA